MGGTDDGLQISLEPQPDLANGITATVLPGACREDFLSVPANATNLTVTAGIGSDTGLLSVEVCPLGASGSDCQSLRIAGGSTNTSVTIDKFSNPPLNAGSYIVRLCNQGPDPIEAEARATIGTDPNGLARTRFTSLAPMAIPDNAVSFSTIHVTNPSPVVSVAVGVRIDHPRVSDLALTLVSPSGTRVLLDENRGSASPGGTGFNVIVTNGVSASSSGGPAAATNIINTPATSGNLAIDYDFYDQPDTMHVYYGTNRIFDSGLLSDSGTFNISYGPGDSSVITIIIDEGRVLTEWDYTVTITSPAFVYTTFTENTNLTVTPFKFAPPPFTNVTLNPVTLAPSSGIFYLPEEPLDKVAGEFALGDWQLEIRDSRAGATNPAPTLVSWQLAFLFKEVMPLPLPLTLAAAQTNAVAPGRIQYYSVSAPPWAGFATNRLISATAPVNLLFNQGLLPTGTNSAPPDFALLSGSVAGSSTLAAASGLPRLVPGAPYFLGVQNTNATTVTFALAVDFDITPLAAGVPVAASIAAGPLPRYFYFDVPPSATAVSFELLNLSGNADLVARKGLPLPTPASFDYGSFYPGTSSEQILVFTNSAPVVLSPGRWYLGVFNADVTNVSATVLASEYTNPLPGIVTLESGISFANTNSGGGSPIDYYCFTVTSNALRAQFEIDHPTGDTTLVARRGLPPPDLASYDLLSANPGTNDELIVLFDYSRPVRLNPGEWFLSAINLSSFPVTYSIMATEFPVYGTNITITSCVASSNSFCFAWNSVPHIHYCVQGLTNLASTNWFTFLPTVAAIDSLTSWCLPLPSPYHFFRVQEGLALSSGLVPVSITSITVSTNGVLLQWSAPTNSQFGVQWTPSLPPSWAAFTNTITSTNGSFSFLDDGSQSAGIGPARFYRLLQFP